MSLQTTLRRKLTNYQFLFRKKQENFALTKNYRLNIVNQACKYVTANVWLIEITSSSPFKTKNMFLTYFVLYLYSAKLLLEKFRISVMTR